MATGIEIALEMARQFEAGGSADDAIAAVRRTFPKATPAEIQRACMIGIDQVEMWEENEELRREDIGKLWDLMVSGAADAEIAGAVERIKLTADNVMPRKPRADAS